LADALKLVEDAAERIWTPEGRIALAYLRRRGLTDETITQARLGWASKVSIPVKDGIRYWLVSGIVIPWVDRGRLAMAKIRRRTGEDPKYAEAFRDRPSMFPTPEAVCTGKPLVIVEGEFDALLLGQALGDLAAVVTLGSASARPEGSTYLGMLPAPVWYLGTDADAAGEKAAKGWPARAVRVEPPSGKDWTEAAQAGVDLRQWWTARLEGTEAAAPEPAPWKVSPSGDVERDMQSPSGTEALPEPRES
jgi:DNA primase